MHLHQFQINFVPAEDRILLRVTYRDNAGTLYEIRAWLTRRLTRNLWPKLLETLETKVALDNPEAAHARTAIVGMDHQASMQAMQNGGNFGQPFEAGARHFPMGETPFIVMQVKFGMSAGKPVTMEFFPPRGNSFTIALTNDLLHGFCRLMQTSIEESGWDFSLQRPWDNAAMHTGSQTLN